MSKKLTQNHLNILKAWTDSREFGAAELLKRLLAEHAELKAELERRNKARDARLAERDLAVG